MTDVPALHARGGSMSRLQVKNWRVFQHYKERTPPWIKLQRTLLDDFDYQRLPLASKALAPMLWLLASESEDGSIDADPERLAFRLRWPEADIITGLAPLIEKGFLTADSEALAERLRAAAPEAEVEGEAKRGADAPPAPGAALGGSDTLSCPVGKIVNLYHDLMPNNPRCKVLNEQRKRAIRTRWREAASLDCPPFGYKTQEDGIKAWTVFFEVCNESKFLTGRVDAQKGKPVFQADIDFLFSPSGFAKCLEEKYHRDAP